MKIGELAAASGCHLETIRYYERIGLLPPPDRTESGYRRYTPQDARRVRFIANGRDLGFSLEEIRSLLALAEDTALSCTDVDSLARRHLGEIHQRINELRQMALELEKTIDGCGAGRRADCAILDALQGRGSRVGPGPKKPGVHGPR